MDFLQKYQTLPKGNLKIDYTKKNLDPCFKQQNIQITR